MRKLTVGFLCVLLFILVAVVIAGVLLPRSAPVSAEQIVLTDARLARGDYLFNAVLGCPVCHSERDFSRFGGPPVEPFGGGRACAAPGEKLPGLAEAGGLPGTICFRNISSDQQTGVGRWTDGELMRAIREGIHRDGDALFPIMPYFIYRNLSDEDTRALVTYVRSVPPVDHRLPDTDINFPVNLLIRLLPEPADVPVAHPDLNNELARGEYLTTIARCAFCHTPRDPRSRQAYPGMEFAGGVEFQGKNGLFYSTNLTPHSTGLGDVSREEFIALFKRADAPAGSEINLMPWTYFSAMSARDLGAMYTYLQSLPATESGQPDP